MPARKNRPTLPPAAADEQSTDTVGAAAFFGVMPRTVQDWRIRGTGPKFIRISRNCVRYRIKDLIAWQEARLRTNTVEP